MKFESELKNGNFVIGKCIKCNKISWPPSDYCSKCFGNLIWRDASRIGKLIEYSKKNLESFCVAEFENEIRIMGALVHKTQQPQVGSKIRLEKCGIKDGKYIFVMNLD